MERGEVVVAGVADGRVLAGVDAPADPQPPAAHRCRALGRRRRRLGWPGPLLLLARTAAASGRPCILIVVLAAPGRLGAGVVAVPAAEVGHRVVPIPRLTARTAVAFRTGTPNYEPPPPERPSVGKRAGSSEV